MTEKRLICFVIMPISDQEGYKKGHFSRVYEYLIKPACEKVGFVPVRADDETKTNYIVIDIIKKILESDIVICDLSAKNPNVLYELGLRQAFNKKALLIKDIKTGRIFDIQGLRTIDYDESLRVDSVQKDINSLAKSLKETYESNESEVNSLIQLLSIKPAVLNESVELSNESSLILNAISDIQNRITSIEKNGTKSYNVDNDIKEYIIDGKEFTIGWSIYLNGEDLGDLIEVQADKIIVKSRKNKIIVISSDNPDFNDLISMPF